MYANPSNSSAAPFTGKTRQKRKQASTGMANNGNNGPGTANDGIAIKLPDRSPDFDAKMEKFDAYVSRFKIFATCYEVSDERKLLFFLASVGPKIFLLTSMCAPNEPTTLTFEKAVKLLTEHLCPKLLTHTERHNFRNRKQ